MLLLLVFCYNYYCFLCITFSVYLAITEGCLIISFFGKMDITRICELDYALFMCKIVLDSGWMIRF